MECLSSVGIIRRHVRQEVCLGLRPHGSNQTCCLFCQKSLKRHLSNLVIGMLLSSVSERILAFVGMLVCFEEIHLFLSGLFLLGQVCMVMALVAVMVVADLTENLKW